MNSETWILCYRLFPLLKSLSTSLPVPSVYILQIPMSSFPQTCPLPLIPIVPVLWFEASFCMCVSEAHVMLWKPWIHFKFRFFSQLLYLHLSTAYFTSDECAHLKPVLNSLFKIKAMLFLKVFPGCHSFNFFHIFLIFFSMLRIHPQL